MSVCAAPSAAGWAAQPGPRPSSVAERALGLYREHFPAAAREPRLRGVIADTLAAPGGMTRLQLALTCAEILGLPGEAGDALATGIEYFHTASLILDDLPSMDDAHRRRGRACVHRAHGEAAATLGALAFINRAYALFWRALSMAPAGAREEAAAHTERCLGAAGILDGQCADLHFAESDRSARTVARVALGKTVSMLRLTLVTPALVAGTAQRERVLLDRLAVAWGLAYQIADDFGDLGDGDTLGKTPGRDVAGAHPNYVVAAGTNRAAQRLEHLLCLVARTHGELVAVRSGWRRVAPLVDHLVHSARLASDSVTGVLSCA